MTPNEALARWTDERPKYREFSKVVQGQLEDLAHANGIHAAVSAREKDPHGFITKIFRKLYTDPWDQMTDKAGARVVVPFNDEVDAFVELVRQQAEFEVVGEVDDKRLYYEVVGDHDATRRLEYSGVHFQLAMDFESEVLECEVQVRTIAQDAWSVVSHTLVYKPVVELPKEEQHAIFRLVALVEIFDQEVKRVANLAELTPSGAERSLVDAVEGAGRGLGLFASDRELSAQILSALRGVIPAGDDYHRTLRAYAEQNGGDIRAAFETYGSGSGTTPTFEWLLLGQPELIVVLDRLESDPAAVIDAWSGAGLPLVWLIKAAEFKGIEYPRL